MLWHIMNLYAHCDVKDFVLALGYKGEVIKEYFYHYALFNNDATVGLGRHRSVKIHNTADEEDWSVTLANTGEHTLKGARLKRIEPYISEKTFMATYGDGVANIDIPRLLDFHRRHGKLATLTGVRPPSLYGELQVSDGRATLFVEKPQASSGMINGGFFVLEPAVIDLIEGDSTPWEDGPLSELASQGQLVAYKHRGFWQAMDTLRDKTQIQKLWNSGDPPWKVWV